MSSYKELLKQREALEQKINEARRNELSEAVSQVRALVTEFGLTAQDVFPAGKARSPQIPQPCHRTDLDRPWQGPQVDSK